MTETLNLAQRKGLSITIKFVKDHGSEILWACTG